VPYSSRAATEGLAQRDHIGAVAQRGEQAAEVGLPVDVTRDGLGDDEGLRAEPGDPRFQRTRAELERGLGEQHQAREQAGDQQPGEHGARGLKPARPDVLRQVETD
jgi:hypothetical protein